MARDDPGPRESDPLRVKTKLLAVGILRIVDALNSRDISTQVMARQLVRSATSVGANYRAATRARSSKEMYAKLAIVEEEADEVMYWIELMQESGRGRAEALTAANDLAHEIVAMVVSSKKTLTRRMGRNASAPPRGDAPSALDIQHSTLRNPRSRRMQ